MKRVLPAIALVTVVALSATSVVGCARSEDAITASGRVVDNTTVVAAPALPSPVPDVTSGVTTSTPGSQPRGSAVATLTGTGQRMRVASVKAAIGDRVKAGQELARLDDSALRAAVDSARATKDLAFAQIRVIDARLSDIASARATIADTRATVFDAITQVTGTRAQLEAKLAQAKALLPQLEAQRAQLEKKRAQLLKQRGQLEKQLAQLEQQLANLPPGADPAPLRAAIAKVKAGIGQINAGLGQIDAGIAKIDAGIAQLTAGIAKLEGALGKLDAGLATAQSGLAKLNTASATAADARTTLDNLKPTAEAAAQATLVGVDLAKLQRDLAIVRAPVDGVVTDIVSAGEVVVAGAPIATIRQDGTAEVEIWLAPDKAAAVAKGDAATVRIDARTESYDAKVSEIGARAEYPPAWLATQETHLTRAVPLRVTLDDPSVTLPEGTPADVVIRLGK